MVTHWLCSSLTQPNQGEDCDSDGDDGGDRGTELHSGDKGLPGELEQGFRGACVQLVGSSHSGTESVAGLGRRRGRDVGWNVVTNLLAVERYADAPENGNPQRPAKLGCGLGDPRGRSCPLGWGGADNEPSGQAENRRQSGRDDNGADDEHRQAVGRANSSEHQQTYSGDTQSTGDQVRRGDPLHDARRQL